MQRDVAHGRCPAQREGGHVERADDLLRPQVELHDHLAYFAAVGIAQRHLEPAGRFGDRELVEHVDHRNGVGGGDGDRHVLRHHRGEPTELGAEHCGGLVGPGAPVVVAATRIGEPRDELFVVAVGETDDRRGDAVGTAAGHQRGELVDAHQPGVGVPIGEHHDARHGIGAW